MSWDSLWFVLKALELCFGTTEEGGERERESMSGNQKIWDECLKMILVHTFHIKSMTLQTDRLTKQPRRQQSRVQHRQEDPAFKIRLPWKHPPLQPFRDSLSYQMHILCVTLPLWVMKPMCGQLGWKIKRFNKEKHNFNTKWQDYSQWSTSQPAFTEVQQ